MGILDELKKLTHPYDDEDEEYEDFEEPRERSFDCLLYTSPSPRD